jgi:hypothetical protein
MKNDKNRSIVFYKDVDVINLQGILRIAAPKEDETWETRGWECLSDWLDAALWTGSWPATRCSEVEELARRSGELFPTISSLKRQWHKNCDPEKRFPGTGVFMATLSEFTEYLRTKIN